MRQSVSSQEVIRGIYIYIYILSFFKQSVMKGRSQVGVYYIIYFIIQQWA